MRVILKKDFTPPPWLTRLKRRLKNARNSSNNAASSQRVFFSKPRRPTIMRKGMALSLVGIALGSVMGIFFFSQLFTVEKNNS